MTTTSAPPPPRDRHRGTPPFVQAILATGALMAALALLIGIVQSGESPDNSAAAGMDGGMPSGGASTEMPTPNPTSTPSAPLVVILATETPEPTRAPRPTAAPVPTCPPKDQNDRDRICSVPTPMPTVRSAASPSAKTPAPLPTCGLSPIDACLMEASGD